MARDNQRFGSLVGLPVEKQLANRQEVRMKRKAEGCRPLILISNRNAGRSVSGKNTADRGFIRPLTIVGRRRNQAPPKNDLPPAA
jgi:hypothetical protein